MCQKIKWGGINFINLITGYIKHKRNYYKKKVFEWDYSIKVATCLKGPKHRGW